VERKLGFIGAGAMAEALIGGVITAGIVAAPDVVVTNRRQRERLAALEEAWGVRTVTTKRALTDEAGVLVLAVKPHDVPVVMRELEGLVDPARHLIVSVAAGVTLSYLEGNLPRGTQVVRAMPNTSCRVKESATAVCFGRWVTPEARNLALEIFGAVGEVVVVEEDAIDAVTGLSGSGPAYVYYLLEALVDAGVRMGLSRDVAGQLARQTLAGAAKMLEDTGEAPARLREMVTSPGGTTMAGITCLEERGFRQAIMEAVRRATERSRELTLTD